MKKFILEFLILRALEKHAYWKAKALAEQNHWLKCSGAESEAMAAKYLERSEYLIRLQNR